jgi:hypothetical protein
MEFDECSRSTRISNIYYSLNEMGKFRFPEQEILNINPDKLAISVSGGGTRSMTCAIGHFRALIRYDRDILSKLSYLSGVSGGSWFVNLFGLSNVSVDNFLGESIPIHDINRHTLVHTNYTDPLYLGNVISNFPVFDVIYNGFMRGVDTDKLWELMCSEIMLKSYKLNNTYVCYSEEDANLQREFNNIKCSFPRKNFPFIITASATLEEDQIFTHEDVGLYEFTPMYSGIRVPNHKYGGILFANDLFGCEFREINSATDHVEILTIPECEDATIEMSIASSSAAFGVEALKLTHTSLPFASSLSQIRLRTKVWGFTSKEEHEINLIDGGFLDYTGIISLAARGCKKILAFINCNRYTGNYCDFGITQLFGVDEGFKCYGCELREKVRIFSVEDWIAMRLDFEKRVSEGKLGYFHRKMNVLHNWRVGVNGGYETELLIIPLYQHKSFYDELKIDINSPDFYDLRDMPNIDYLISNENRALELPNSEVNFLSTYTDWYLTEIIKELPDFFNEI